MQHRVMLNMGRGELVKWWKVNRQNSAQGPTMGNELAIITPTSLNRLMSLRGAPGYGESEEQRPHLCQELYRVRAFVCVSPL